MNQGFLSELLSRYAGSLIEQWALVLVAVAAALAVATLGKFRLLARVTGWRRVAVLVIVAAAALLWAWRLKWLCDDAYISFRYAENWAKGLGPVFNPGERVEGYTNFLWTAVLALFIKLGAHPAQVALIISLACFVGSLVLLDRLANLLASVAGRGAGIAPLLAGASLILASFATSGLETMFAATLALLAVERAESGRPLAAGLAGVAAAMSHPDHGIFYVALGVALLWQALAAPRREHWRDLLWFAVPFVAVYLPYFVWRWHYYGDLFPNTYYAKSADQSYFEQGGIYLLATLVAAGVWAAAPLAIVGAWQSRHRLSARFVVVAVPLFLLYVAKIGGDFMLGRLLVSVILLVFLFADVGFRELSAQGRSWLAGALLGLAALAAVPAQVIRPYEKVWNLSDERTFYPLRRFNPPLVAVLYARQADSLTMALAPRQLAPKLAVGCVGIVGYETRLPLFDLLGLTSRSVARQPILQRGRPGHEKVGTPGQMMAAGVDLAESVLYPDPFGPLTRMRLGGFTYYLSRWDQGFADKLAGVARFADFPGFVRKLAADDRPAAPDVVACENWFLESFYFSKNQDPGLRHRLVNRAVASDSTLRGLEPLLLSDRSLESRGYQRVHGFSFDQHEPWEVTGDAFAGWPQGEAIAGQSSVFGHAGKFVSSYRPIILDRARGRMKLPPFAVKGDVISLMIGGGRDLNNLRVSLVVDGQAKRVATGCGSELLGRRLWNVREYIGRTAHIEIVDGSTSGWGHILVDELVQWQAPPPRATNP